MASTSHLSRYQPAVLTVVAAAAGYGIYLLYTCTSTQSPSLHRSNAIHRPRRDRTSQSIDHVPPTPDSLLGTIMMRSGDRSYNIDLATTPLPSIQDLQQLQLFTNLENFRRELEDKAFGGVLTACYTASQNPDTWDQIEQYGFKYLLEAMATRDEDQIRLEAIFITRYLQLNDFGQDRSEQAVTTFFESSTWRDVPELDSDDDRHGPAETEYLDMLNTTNREPNQGLRGLLYYIAEEDAKRKAYEHRGIHCEECGEQPIRGIRWHCLNCPDFDLCSSCELGSQHPKTHVFAKIKIPLPVLSQPTKEYPLWYPGDPQKIHRSLDAVLKKNLCLEHSFEEPQMDAFYDQFICLANVPNPLESPTVEAAMDRRAFNKAMTCEKWPQRFAANAMYDRMFFFYDTDGNGIIDFEEFVSGLAYLRGPNRYESLKRAISGYDIDGDGFIERSDFLRLLRAKYDIQRQLVSDMVQGQDAELTQGSLDVLRSSQPISSVFAQEDIPPGESRHPHGKILDAFGDMQPVEGTKTILDDEDSWPRRIRRFSGGRRTQPAHEQLRSHLSRFAEMIHDPGDQPRTSGPAQANGRPFYVRTPSDQELDDLIDMGTGDNSRLDDYEDDEPGVFSRHYSNQVPHVQDILWEVTQNGMNELLEGIFSKREDQDRQASATSMERMRWRQEIDEEKEAQEARREAIARDPLMATAWASSQTGPRRMTLSRSPEPANKLLTPNDIFPTDPQSLERRERQISQTPLEDLLHTSGYGVRDTDGLSPENSPPRVAHAGSSSIWDGRRQHAARSPLSSIVSSVDNTAETFDPTLPQNRPNEIPTKKQPSLRRSRGKSITSEQGARLPGNLPSMQRLLYLAQMDEVEKQMEERGGPGRLSYDEIEKIAKEDLRGEVDGLIRSWLEWASF